MAGENPEDVERDEHGNAIVRSDEFLSKTKWERFQVLIMGPVMNLLLAVVLTAVVLYQGVEKGVVRGSAGRRRRRDGRTRRRRRPTSGRAIGSCRSAGRDVDTWEQFLIAVGTKPNREISIGLLRNGLRADAHGDADAVAGPEPVRVRRHRRAAERASARRRRSRRASPAERAGLKAGDVDRWRSTASRSRSH